MAISDLIASFIMDLVENEEGNAELCRSDIARQFNCVPSQINYVISTRFSPELGYIVESRRGGGGYIRIQKVSNGRCMLMHAVNSIGGAIDQQTARVFLSNLAHSGVITEHERQMMAAGLSDAALRSLPPEQRDSVRAGVFKQMLIAVS